jgi:hypothetical protein
MSESRDERRTRIQVKVKAVLAKRPQSVAEIQQRMGDEWKSAEGATEIRNALFHLAGNKEVELAMNWSDHGWPIARLPEGGK